MNIPKCTCRSGWEKEWGKGEKEEPGKERHLPWCVVHQCQLSKEPFIIVLEDLDKNNIKNKYPYQQRTRAVCDKTQTSLESMPF